MVGCSRLSPWEHIRVDRHEDPIIILLLISLQPKRIDQVLASLPLLPPIKRQCRIGSWIVMEVEQDDLWIIKKTFLDGCPPHLIRGTEGQAKETNHISPHNESKALLIDKRSPPLVGLWFKQEVHDIVTLPILSTYYLLAMIYTKENSTLT